MPKKAPASTQTVAKKATTKKAPVKKKTPAATAVNTAAPKRVQERQAKEIAKKKQAASEQKRPVIYPKFTAQLCIDELALVAEQAKKLIGWDDQNISDDNYDLIDMNGKKIRLWNNPRNRPFELALAKTYAADILEGNWRGRNGETLIIGETGITISAQHRLVGFILAVQIYLQDPSKWRFWKAEPVLECLIVFGVKEDDDTVNTIDSGKPRSTSDVFYRSDYFADMPNKMRILAARTASYAVKLVGHRTGAWVDAFAPKRTHKEILGFTDNHPTLLKCVRRIVEENEKNAIGKYLSPGYAAGMYYLMSLGKSDPTAYRAAGEPGEGMLDVSLYETAWGFWVELANSGSVAWVQAVRATLGKMIHDGGGSVHERLAVIAKAWLKVSAGEPLTEADLELQYHVEDDVRTLIECPTVGGIDYGDPDNATSVSTETVAERAAAERAARTTAGGKKPPSGKRGVGEIQPGEDVWVKDPEGNWQGKLVEVYELHSQRIARVDDGQGHVYETPFKNVSRDEPL